MKQLDPVRAAKKWAQRVQSSGQDYQDGVNAVQENPAQKAIAQADVWVQNVAAAKQKFIDGLAGTTLAGWKTATTNAVASYTGGAAKGQPKMSAFNSQFYPFLAQAVQSLPARGNREVNKTRSTQLQDALAKFAYQRRTL